MDKKRKNYETELPEGYEEIRVIDATDKKTMVWLNIATFVITLAIIFWAFFAIKPIQNSDGFHSRSWFIFALILIVYIVLHELVHGAAYKLTTGRKLTFGLTLSVAYCGVPDIYVYRKTALISLLAPFTVFTVLFGLGVLLMQMPTEKFLCAVLFAFHFGGCSGDLYDTVLFLFQMKDPAILMRDTGPRQEFYQKRGGTGDS